jgi:hypothetical protein
MQALEKAKPVANVARKTASSLVLYTSFSTLVGTFIAMVSGAFGGRHHRAF